MSIAHTYSPTCLLHNESNTFTRRASTAFTGPPPIKSHFFYCSVLPIDDPLSPVPAPASGPPFKTTKLPPRPFSIHDNSDLEEAWLRLQDEERKQSERQNVSEKRTTHPRVFSRASEHVTKSKQAPEEREADQQSLQKSNDSKRTRHALTDVSDTRKDYARKEVPQPQPDLTLSDDPAHIPFDETLPVEEHEIWREEIKSGLRRVRSRSPFHRKKKSESPKSEETTNTHRRLSQSMQKAQDLVLGSSPSERDTSGTPFLRISSRLRPSHSRSRSRSRSRSPDAQAEMSQDDGEAAERSNRLQPSRPGFQRFHSDKSDSGSGDRRRGHQKTLSESQKGEKAQKQKARVPVGVSRLHVVEMPSLKMGPIYWDPVHDVSSVVRGTWFYKDTMWPVEADVANQIEAGYEYIKPWTSTYEDELNVCQEVGPEAELKLVHRLWPPQETPNSSGRPGTSKSQRSPQDSGHEKHSSADKDIKSAAATIHLAENRAAGALDGYDDPVQLFARCSMMYVNDRDAQILRSNQLPSVGRGRKPLANIRKGRPVGIPVVRGFDYRAWEKLYPPTRKIVISNDVDVTLRSNTRGSQKLPACEACMSQAERPRATDLILVIHGIGQKLSERVESYHFTHAINAFRRQLNVELTADAVKPWLRADLGSMMVLPINWRSKINIDDGGPELDPNRKDKDSSKNQFSLKDITAESIPAVRNLISDVLLDIPYYLSKHKPKMIEAVTKEANRVYRLWCINNPGFQENGRVHIMAHSLGSVMTLDILSKQPTRVPRSIDLKSSQVRGDRFEFDTHNLFFLGSPAGLFLFINHAPLLPRKGRHKPGGDGEDLGPRVAGEAGTYGCLAVDNLYNIMHYIDPIAYQLNACVDVKHAASLRRAFVPSTAVTWAQYLGLSKKTAFGAPKALTGLTSFPGRPTAQSMPSTVELETHDFTSEEMAETRMYLLNDNGQIDFTLQSGGGPLEIQYLNMLSAHSSYWTMQDFVRFLVVEIGRKPGKEEAVASLKATKKARGRT